MARDDISQADVDAVIACVVDGFDDRGLKDALLDSLDLRLRVQVDSAVLRNRMAVARRRRDEATG